MCFVLYALLCIHNEVFHTHSNCSLCVLCSISQLWYSARWKRKRLWTCWKTTVRHVSSAPVRHLPAQVVSLQPSVHHPLPRVSIYHDLWLYCFIKFVVKVPSEWCVQMFNIKIEQYQLFSHKITKFYQFSFSATQLFTVSCTVCSILCTLAAGIKALTGWVEWLKYFTIVAPVLSHRHLEFIKWVSSHSTAL